MCHVSRICKRVPPSMPQDTVNGGIFFGMSTPYNCSAYTLVISLHLIRSAMMTHYCSRHLMKFSRQLSATGTMTLMCQNSVIHTQYMRLC